MATTRRILRANNLSAVREIKCAIREVGRRETRREQARQQQQQQRTSIFFYQRVFRAADDANTRDFKINTENNARSIFFSLFSFFSIAIRERTFPVRASPTRVRRCRDFSLLHRIIDYPLDIYEKIGRTAIDA